MRFSRYIWMVVLVCLTTSMATAQSEKARLEARKAKIQQEINQYSKLLKNVQKEEANVILLVETLNKKIASTQEIINITNKQANLIARNIDKNTKEIKKLEAEIKALKQEYAKMIVKAYKSKNAQSRLMFLLSSEDFLQAYKRVQYLKAYANYRKKQADEITATSELLKEKNATLAQEKKEKEQILIVNRKQRTDLKEDKTEQENLLAVVKANEKKNPA